MKKKPVLAYILSSIAMVLVCFGYYLRIHYWSPLKIQDIQCDISFIWIPVFFISLLCAIRGGLRANIICTGFMTVPIVVFFRYFMGFNFPDVLFLISFSFSIVAVSVSIYAMDFDSADSVLNININKAYPIAYVLFTLIFFGAVILLGAFDTDILRLLSHVMHGTIIPLFGFTLPLLVCFTFSLLKREHAGHTIVPVLLVISILLITPPIQAGTTHFSEFGIDYSGTDLYKPLLHIYFPLVVFYMLITFTYLSVLMIPGGRGSNG